jgi:methylase of polypeptide subunit release factors
MHVRPGVFIPRWETEEWAIALASRLRKLPPSRQAFTLVDLCSGSGCIPIMLKNFVSANIDKTLYPKYGKPNDLAKFIGIEQSPTAIEVARINLERSQLPDQKYSEKYFCK